MTQKLRVLKNQILFQFVDTVKNGMFESKTDSGIVLTTYYDDSSKLPRAGKIVQFGPDCETEFNIGDVIMIEPLRWSEGVKFEGQTFWRTDESQVLGIVEE